MLLSGQRARAPGTLNAPAAHHSPSLATALPPPTTSSPHQVVAADLAGESSMPAEFSADLFSLGVLAWEVMTGKRFYGGAPAHVGWGCCLAMLIGAWLRAQCELPDLVCCLHSLPMRGRSSACPARMFCPPAHARTCPAPAPAPSPTTDASDGEVVQMLMGHKQLPSEGEGSVLGQITDRNAQRLLRHLIRRNPDKRWDAAKVASCLWFKTSDFQACTRGTCWGLVTGAQRLQGWCQGGGHAGVEGNRLQQQGEGRAKQGWPTAVPQGGRGDSREATVPRLANSIESAANRQEGDRLPLVPLPQAYRVTG